MPASAKEHSKQSRRTICPVPAVMADAPGGGRWGWH
jgi:hypothetical protein